jgi:hypothetical protein
MKHIKGFGSGFTELRAKIDVDTLLDFANHRRQNDSELKKKKHLCKNKVLLTSSLQYMMSPRHLHP